MGPCSSSRDQRLARRPAHPEGRVVQLARGRVSQDYRAERRRQDHPVARGLRAAARRKRLRGLARKVIIGASEEFHTDMVYLGHLNSLKADLTARENLRFLAGLRQALGPADIDGALDRVGILSRGDLPARSLSAGQKRRLALARLLLSGAVLWVLDEPVTNLDTAGVDLSRIGARARRPWRPGARGSAQRLLDDEPILRRLELS